MEQGKGLKGRRHCHHTWNCTVSCMAPRCTGMWGALETRPPSGPKRAQEKSRRSLMLVEMAVRCRMRPICSAGTEWPGGSITHMYSSKKEAQDPQGQGLLGPNPRPSSFSCALGKTWVATFPLKQEGCSSVYDSVWKEHSLSSLPGVTLQLSSPTDVVRTWSRSINP